MERVETLIVGAGQAGLSLSYRLGRLGLEHLVLERGRIRRALAKRTLGFARLPIPELDAQAPGPCLRGR